MTKKYLFFTIIFISLSAPILYMSFNELIPGHDATTYVKAAKNIAEGKGYYINYIGYFKTNKNIFLKNILKYGVKDNLEWIPPVYSYFLSFFYYIFGSTYAIPIAVIVNFFLSLLNILLILSLYKKLNFNNLISILSIILFITTSIFFRYACDKVIEPLFLFFYLLIIQLLFKTSFRLNRKRDLIILGILTSTMVLTKYLGIIYLFPIYIILLLKRQFKSILVLFIFNIILICPYMFIYPYLLIGQIGLVTLSLSMSWPLDSLPQLMSLKYQLLSFYYSGVNRFSILNDFFSSQALYFLMPFSILAFFKYRRNAIVWFIGLSFVIYCIFFILAGAHTIRYAIPLLPFMIPFGLKALLLVFKRMKIHPGIVYALVIVILINNLTLIKDFYSERTNLIKNQIVIKSQLDEMLKDAKSKSNPVIASNDPIITYYLYDIPSVRLPENLSQENLKTFIDLYKITYIVINKMMISSGTFVTKIPPVFQSDQLISSLSNIREITKVEDEKGNFRLLEIVTK